MIDIKDMFKKLKVLRMENDSELDSKRNFSTDGIKVMNLRSNFFTYMRVSQVYTLSRLTSNNRCQKSFKLKIPLKINLISSITTEPP